MGATGEARAPSLERSAALDGIRGIAIGLVLVAHYSEPWSESLQPLGVLGVGIFFTLSGYLITAILLRERDLRDRVDFGAFYVRRAARLLPALMTMLAATVVVGYATWGERGAAMLYFMNWKEASAGRSGGLSFTWSLSIEEQFYLVWPVVMLAALRLRGRRGVIRMAVAGAAVSIGLRTLLYDGSAEAAIQVSRWTFTQMDGLLAGCALAAIGAGRNKPLAAGALIMLGVVGAVATPAWQATTATIATVTGAGAIYLVAGGSGGWLRSRLLGWLGTRSYAIYLWHLPVVIVLLRYLSVGPAILLAIVCTGCIAEASWRLVERPILQAARLRLARREPAPVVVAATS